MGSGGSAGKNLKKEKESEEEEGEEDTGKIIVQASAVAISGFQCTCIMYKRCAFNAAALAPNNSMLNARLVHILFMHLSHCPHLPKCCFHSLLFSLDSILNLENVD